MYDDITKEFSCDYCGNECAGRDFLIVRVANIMLAEICNSCREHAHGVITAVLTKEARQYYDMIRTGMRKGG